MPCFAAMRVATDLRKVCGLTHAKSGFFALNRSHWERVVVPAVRRVVRRVVREVAVDLDPGTCRRVLGLLRVQVRPVARVAAADRRQRRGREVRLALDALQLGARDADGVGVRTRVVGGGDPRDRQQRRHDQRSEGSAARAERRRDGMRCTFRGGCLKDIPTVITVTPENPHDFGSWPMCGTSTDNEPGSVRGTTATQQWRFGPLAPVCL